MKVFKRRRSKRTDYRQRLGLLKSGAPRLVVRRSTKYIHVQIVAFGEKGDATLLEVSSRELRKYGWLCHAANIPAAYLAGLLAGLKAKKEKIGGVILDIGMQTSVKGSSLYAAAAGVVDAGVALPAGEEVLPDRGRISGTHIRDYAARLKKEDGEKYRRMFSTYLRVGAEPEKVTENFEQAKAKIIEEFGAEAKKVVVKSAGGN